MRLALRECEYYRRPGGLVGGTGRNEMRRERGKTKVNRVIDYGGGAYRLNNIPVASTS